MSYQANNALALVLLCTTVAPWSHAQHSLHPADRTVLHTCRLNTLCHCIGHTNETSIHDVSCYDVSLYKFPEFLHSSIRHVEMQHNFLQSVDDDTFQGLRLESLKLVSNQVHTMSPNSLRSMIHSLKALDITGNQFQAIPLDSIRDLNNVYRLNLQRNNIQDVSGDWGHLADSLRVLHLSDNSICQIADDPAAAIINAVDTDSHGHQTFVERSDQSKMIDGVEDTTFAKLRRLTWLDLSGNRINHINTSALPKALVTLDLSRNNFQRIPARILALPHLKILLCAGNLIQNPVIEPLDPAVRLEKLDLSENMIQYLHTPFLSGSVRVNAVNLAKNFIEHLNADTFAQMGVVHMVLAFNRLQHIETEAFRTLEDTLEYLDLERNALLNVQPEALGRLRRLRYLYLTGNLISDVDYLPETLRVLSLAGNNLTRIPWASINRCSDLSYLNMGYNKIANVPDFGFVGWGAQLQTLLLRNNKITELNKDAFSGLTSIKEISLSFNDVHWMHPNVFENISQSLQILELSFGIYRDDFPMEQLRCLTELIWLGLDNNHLKYISDEALITMKELTYINLSFNRIGVLPPNIFVAEVHTQLMDVDLSYNILYTIAPYTFDSVPNLQFVSLAHNRIERLNRHSFNNLPHLMWVDLAHNLLYNITDVIFSLLPSLQRLDLTNNELTTFSFHIFKDVSSDQAPLRLNISHNRISSILAEPSLVSVHIAELDATFNGINDTSSLQHLTTLRRLYLRHNRLNQIGNNAFGDMNLLEILDLSHNNISSLRRRCFQNLMLLQKLDLSSNAIDQLQVEQFANMKNLRILSLKRNQLRTVPRDVFLNTRLEQLDMSENFLTTYPAPALSDVGFTVRSILMASNRIADVDATMFVNTQFLYELDVSNNKLTQMPMNTFMYLHNLTRLELSGNRLSVANLRGVFQYTRRLRYLRIRGLGLNELPTKLSNLLPNLVELDISMNHMQDIVHLNGLQSLRTLNISMNRVTNVTRLGERLPASLRELNISHNPIYKTGERDFASCPFLETLSMLDVKVSQPMFFARLKYLRRLQMTAQATFGECVAFVPGLQQLLLHVPDTSLDSSMFAPLVNNTKINLLEITGTRISKIRGDTFRGFRQNQKLCIRIRGTQLTDLPIGLFYVLNSVSHLSVDLSENRIISLSPDSFYPNASTWDAVGTRSLVGGLDLFRNPLQCDCGLVWLGHWLRRWLRETAQMNVVSREDTRHMLERAKRNTCIDPITGIEMSFLDLFPEDLLCHASALSSIAPKFRVIAKWNVIVLLFLYSSYYYTVLH